MAADKKNAHIGLKMSISIAIPLVALAVVSFLGVQRLESISAHLITSLAEQANKSTAKIINADRDYYQAMQAYLLMANSDKPDEGLVKDYKENAAQTMDRVSGAVELLKGCPAMTIRHEASQKNIPEMFESFKSEFAKWEKAYDPDTNTMKDEEVFNASFSNARENINGMTEILETYADQAITDSNEQVHSTAMFVGATAVLALIVSAVVGFFLARSISTIIRESMGDLLDSAEQISSVSESVANASRQFAEASTEQAASVEEVSATLEETAAMVQANSENSQNAFHLSQNVTTSIGTGSKQMSEMMKSMDEIKSSSNEVTNVLKAIESIAFQTNILSLNAAVEAARAGDAGKGFAVVADEVRGLAHRSSKEAQSIAEIIERNIALSENAATVTAQAYESFVGIQEEVGKISELIDGLAKAGEEQRIGISQISETMQSMGQVVEKIAQDATNNLQMAESLLAPVEEMKGMAMRLSTSQQD